MARRVAHDRRIEELDMQKWTDKALWRVLSPATHNTLHNNNTHYTTLERIKSG